MAVLMSLIGTLTFFVRQDRIEQEKLRKELEQVKITRQIRTLASKQTAVEAVKPPVVEQPVQSVPEPVKAPQTAPSVATQPVESESAAKLWIYQRESGNNPSAVNRNGGACGLGQALPCSKMPCVLGDYACQDQFFTSYMVNRYGTWANAKAFWQSHSWW